MGGAYSGVAGKEEMMSAESSSKIPKQGKEGWVWSRKALTVIDTTVSPGEPKEAGDGAKKWRLCARELL